MPKAHQTRAVETPRKSTNTPKGKPNGSAHTKAETTKAAPFPHKKATAEEFHAAASALLHSLWYPQIKIPMKMVKTVVKLATPHTTPHETLGVIVAISGRYVGKDAEKIADLFAKTSKDFAKRMPEKTAAYIKNQNRIYEEEAIDVLIRPAPKGAGYILERGGRSALRLQK